MNGPFETPARNGSTIIIDQKIEPVMDDIADQLRLIRLTSHQRRYPGKPVPRLPSRATIIQIQTNLVGLLYPRHFGPEGLEAEAIDRHVRLGLDNVRQHLAEQIWLECLLTPGDDEKKTVRDAQAAADEFLQTLPRLRALHDTDIAAAYQGDPSAKSIDEVISCYPGLAAVLRHRIAHQLYTQGITMIARIMVMPCV